MKLITPRYAFDWLDDEIKGYYNPKTKMSRTWGVPILGLFHGTATNIIRLMLALIAYPGWVLYAPTIWVGEMIHAHLRRSFDERAIAAFIVTRNNNGRSIESYCLSAKVRYLFRERTAYGNVGAVVHRIAFTNAFYVTATENSALVRNSSGNFLMSHEAAVIVAHELLTGKTSPYLPGGYNKAAAFGCYWRFTYKIDSVNLLENRFELFWPGQQYLVQHTIGAHIAEGHALTYETSEELSNSTRLEPDVKMVVPIDTFIDHMNDLMRRLESEVGDKQIAAALRTTPRVH